MSIMIFQSSGIQGKKIKAGGNDENHDDLEAAVCHPVLEEVSEDILLEILIRLPDCQHAIRTGIVCHSWHALISQHPQFIPRFISHHHQHQDRYLPPPYAIIFRKADKNGFSGVQHFQPICKLFSEESMLCTRTNFLEFLPSPMVIRGSCKDLLLVSPGSRVSSDFYICNPITKQFVQLPEIRRPHDHPCLVTGHALVCLPPGPTNKLRFKVVEFEPPIYPEIDHITIQPINVYCSESRKWEIISFHYPRAKTSYTVISMHAAVCNGTLYWLEYEFNPERVFSLDLSLDDLSNCQLGVIDIPNGCIFDFQKARVQIGGVHLRGEDLVELRFLQVVGTGTAVDLKVWKLDFNTTNEDNWVLVHDKKMLKWPKPDNKGKQFLAPFLHPTKGDVVFMVWGQKVFQYDLEETTTTCEMIDEIQEPLILNNSRSYPIVDQILSFPMVHPTWPTLLPYP